MPVTPSSGTTPLSRAQAFNAVGRLVSKLRPAVGQLAQALLGLLEADGTVALATVHKSLFPVAATTSASAQLSKLLSALESAATESNLLLTAQYSGAKRAGVANRRLYFVGPGSELIADMEGLDALPPGHLVPGQSGQLIDAERTIILLTFNEHEFAAVRKAFCAGRQPATRNEQGVIVDDLGEHSGSTVLLYYGRQGSRESQRAAAELLRAFEPDAMIAVGIAFGSDQDKQSLSDVLVSMSVHDYESGKVHKDGTLTLRGAPHRASRRLTAALQFLNQDRLNSDARLTWPRVHFGGLLSGEKLVDNLSYREQLKKLTHQDDIVGGEMEAIGLATALEGHRVDWVVVKAICDWGDGDKSRDTARRQQDATENAASVVKALLTRCALYSNATDVADLDGKCLRQSGDRIERGLQLSHRQHLPEMIRGEPLVDGQKGLPTTLETTAEAIKSVESGREADRRTVNAFDDIIEWATGPRDRPLYALLGEYGIGKTTTCQRVASALRERRHQGDNVPLPLYFDLRKVERVVAVSAHSSGRIPTLQEAIEDCLRHGYLHEGGESPRYEEVLNAIDDGALVIFDGLDEVLARIGDRQGLSFTANLLKVFPEAQARKKARAGTHDQVEKTAPRVLISCRTQFFRNLTEQNNHFTGEHRGARPASQYRALLLLPFTEDEIRTYLRAVFPDADCDALMREIESVHNLRELAARPFTLKLVAQFVPRLEQWRLQGRRVTGATLYREVAREWLIRDKQKQSFQPEDKELLAGDLAAALWKSGKRGLSARELEAWLGQWLAQQDPHADFHTRPRDLLQEDLRNSTFLKRTDGARPEESRFEFAHNSLHEFFLADHLLRALQTGDRLARVRWALPRVSEETLDFLGQMLAEEHHEGSHTSAPSALATLSAWRAPYLERASELQLAYCLRAWRRGLPCPTLVGMDLSRADLSDWHFGSEEEEVVPGGPRLNLREINLEGAKLRRTRFWHVRLNGARFAGAVATQAEFLHCQAEGIDWTDADLAGAVFRYSSFWQTEQSVGSHRTLADYAARETARFILCDMPVATTWLPAENVQIGLCSGHTSRVVALAFSPDGRWLASGGAEEKTLRLWNADTGTCVRVLHGHEDGVTTCAFSPDGQWLASGADDRTLRLWNADTGACVRVLHGHEDHVTTCAFSPDGQWLASGADDKTLRLWNTDTGECMRVLHGHEDSVTTCAFSPDGQWLASGADDKILRLWNTDMGECMRVLHGHEDSVTTCAFSPDGQWLASGADDKTLRLWNTGTGVGERILLGHASSVSSCAFSPDGRWLASGADNKTLRLWNTDAGVGERILVGHANSVSSCAFSPDGRWLASGATDNTLRLWNADTGECVRVLHGRRSCATSCAFSPDGQWLASGAVDNTLRLWNADTGACVRVLHGHEDNVTTCAFSPDGQWLASGADDRTLRLWNADTGECMRILQGHKSNVTTCAFSPNGQWLASGADDRTLRLWNADTGECVRVLQGHKSIVTACAFSPDGRWLASGADDSSVRLWNADTGECVRILQGHQNCVTTCTFSPDGRWLASGAGDKTVRLWNAATGRCVRVLRGHEDSVTACALSPDGRWLASGAWDNTVRLWSAATGECVRVLREHEDCVTTCAFSPDGRWLASGAYDGTLRLWDTESGKCVRVHLSVRRGSAAWRPDTNEVLHARGAAWRYLGWFGQDANGDPAVWPLEVAPVQVMPGE